MTEQPRGEDTSRVTRIEIIDQTGRAYVGYGFSDVKLSMQDDGRTLKIFTHHIEMSASEIVEAMIAAGWKAI